MRLTIDSQEIEVPAGTTVKRAAEIAGIKIPGLCDHPELEPYGGCRLCLVEIEGMRGYPSSCTLPVSEGMKVSTSTQALQDLRLSILEMLLSEHPSGCLTCDRAGRCDEIREPMRKVPQTMGCRYCPKDGVCELQETVMQIGLEKIDLSRIAAEKEVVRSPFFDRDPNLCILCMRCVRSCQSRGLGVIANTFRGFDSGIGTAFDRPLEEVGCRFCGACVDVCPTGALQERGSRWQGQADRIVPTVCPYCSANCRLEIEVKDEMILRSKALECRLCVRGRFGLEFVHRERLTRPLIRRGDRLVESSWEEARERAAERLPAYSGRDFAMLVSGVLTNEALWTALMFAEQVMQSSATAEDVSTAFDPEEIARGPVLVVGDLAKTCPALELLIRPARPVYVSALRTLLAEKASVWLQPRPGDEALVLAALARAYLQEQGNHGLQGTGRSGGFDGFALAAFSRALQTAGSAGVPQEKIREAARTLAGASVVVAPDCSPLVRKAAENLALAVDGRLCLVGRNCNSRGAAAFGLHRGYEETMQSLRSGEIKAAYVIGSNPARADASLEEPLANLEFLVVQDLFLTETARLADVVLPAASFAEIDGTFTSSDGRMLQLSPAIPTQQRSDAQILSALRLRMKGYEYDYQAPEAVAKAQEEHLQSMLALEREKLKDRSRARLEDPGKDLKGDEKGKGKGPYLLVEGPSLFEFGSGTRTSRVYDLQYLNRERIVEINPKDARELGINDGDPVRLEPEGPDGVAIKASARISGRVPAGVMRINALVGRVRSTEVRRDV